MRLAFLFTLITVADSYAFHLNRVDASLMKGGRNSVGILQYRDSNRLDLEEGEMVFTGSPSQYHNYGAMQSHRQLSDRRYSASDWLYNLKTWRHSSVLKDIRNPVITLGSWATVLSLLHKVLCLTGRSNWALHITIPPVAHSFLVSSIGLLLVFRTNSAYQRFLEGRKIWEQVSSISRNLSRLITMYQEEVGKDRRKRMMHLLAAFPYLLRHQVQNGCLCIDDSTSIEERNKLCLLEPNRPERYCFVDRTRIPWSLLEEAQKEGCQNILHNIAQVTNRPLWICDRMSKEIMEIPIGPSFSTRERLKLLNDVDKLANAIGSCERIHQTAVPLHYARHALRSLTVWIVTLPFSLVKDFGMLTGPVTAMVAWLLFGVYQIGHSIEDPFQGSLRLSALCEDIRQDILENLNGQISEDSILRDKFQFDLLSNNFRFCALLDELAAAETSTSTMQEKICN